MSQLENKYVGILTDIYNKLRLGEKLDLFNLYGEEDEVLKVLNNK